MISKYSMPTKVMMGRDCVGQNAGEFKALGRKALIITGARSAKRNGSESDVKKALDLAGVAYAVFDKVMSNPTIACVYEGAALARAQQADCIIAIGGGSPMDAAKAIALLAVQDIDRQDLFSGNYQHKVLPMAFVPTTAGTGSEVTPYAVLTDDEAQTKMSIASELLFPKVALLDAAYTQGLPITTTINTAVDALAHAVEGMLAVKASAVSNALAVAGIGLIMDCIPEILQGLNAQPAGKLTLQTREQLLQASLLAGMVIAQTSTTAVHAMGYSLTYFKEIDHGRANGLLLGEYLKLVEKVRPDLAQNILTALRLPDAAQFRELTDKLFGPKETLTLEEIQAYSQRAIQAKNIGNCVVKPQKEEIEAMYFQSFFQ